MIKISKFGKASYGIFAFVISLIIIVFIVSSCQQNILYSDNRILMGTTVEVISPCKDASRIVFAEFKRIESLLSRYDSQSEISLLNKNSKIKATPETIYIIKKAKEFYEITDGDFDITVGRLMDLWGFRNKKYRVPTEQEIRQELKFTGSDKIIIDESKKIIEFSVIGVEVDLGGIAKGYAIDSAVRKLKEAGIESCLINAGGQIYCLGKRFDRQWRVGIKDPRDMKVEDFIEIKEGSVSTSGDYEQFFVLNNKRYGHIINPKTGYPVESGILSVSVITRNAVDADALSTAIFVLGEKKAKDLMHKFSEVEARIFKEDSLVIFIRKRK